MLQQYRKHLQNPFSYRKHLHKLNHAQIIVFFLKRALIILIFYIQSKEKRRKYGSKQQPELMPITYNGTQSAPSNCFWFLLSQKITFSSSISFMSDRSFQVNPEHSRNRGTASVACLTVAQPHFMNERAFQLLLRLQLVWAGAPQRWSNVTQYAFM